MKQILKRVGRWGKRMAIASATAIVVIGTYHKLTEAPPHQPEETEQIRGMWMTHVGNAFYAATGQLDDVFHQLSRLNFNRVYISVYNDRGDLPQQGEPPQSGNPFDAGEFPQSSDPPRRSPGPQDLWLV